MKSKSQGQLIAGFLAVLMSALCLLEYFLAPYHFNVMLSGAEWTQIPDWIFFVISAAMLALSIVSFVKLDGKTAELIEKIVIIASVVISVFCLAEPCAFMAAEGYYSSLLALIFYSAFKCIIHVLLAVAWLNVRKNYCGENGGREIFISKGKLAAGLSDLTAAALCFFVCSAKIGIDTWSEILSLVLFFPATALLITISILFFKYPQKISRTAGIISAVVAEFVAMLVFIESLTPYYGGIYSICLFILCSAAFAFYFVFNFKLISNDWVELAKAEKGAQCGGVPQSSGYVSLGVHIACMLLVPFWIYVWIYRATKYLNRVEGEPYRDPAKKLLLCLFVPFYIIYWTYKSAQLVDKYATQNGVMSELATVCVVLSIFIAIVPPIFMQQKINEIETADGKTQNIQKQSESVTAKDIADSLKQYKELLDDGIITQEEFEIKKSEILNMKK